MVLEVKQCLKTDLITEGHCGPGSRGCLLGQFPFLPELQEEPVVKKACTDDSVFHMRHAVYHV